jgi:hypothetical protein
MSATVYHCIQLDLKNISVGSHHQELQECTFLQDRPELMEMLQKKKEEKYLSNKVLCY